MMKQRIGAGLVLFALTLTAAFLSLSLAENQSHETRFKAIKGFRKTAATIIQDYVEEPDKNDLLAWSLSGVANTLKAEDIDFATAEFVEAASPVKSLPELEHAFDQAVRSARGKIQQTELTLAKIYQSGLTGMLSGLSREFDDSYSYYLSPEEAEQLQHSLHNESFGGIGVYIEYLAKEQKILVLSVLPDTPAFRSGLKPGDLIIAVDGTPLPEIPIDSGPAASKRIRGEIGTEVVLTIQREGVPEPLDFTVTRDRVVSKQTFKADLTDEVGYIRIDNFTQEAGEELEKYLEYFNSAGKKGLVLDLRSNPGGLLNAAVDVSALFLGPGKLITYTQGRPSSEGERHYREYRAPSTAKKWDKLLVVLVDGRSASASEIVTGALKDHGRATIAGLKTFGKGSVQEIFSLPDNANLRLTVAYYFTPSGVCIHRIGIVPDIEVPYEQQVSEASPEIESATAADEVEEATEEDSTAYSETIDRRSYLQRRRDALLKDFQVQTAIEILQSKIDSPVEVRGPEDDTSRI